MNEQSPPVITIDGPAACGKGVIAKKLAQHLHWYLLDSGIFYRALAWGLLTEGISNEDESTIVHWLEHFEIKTITPGPGKETKVFFAENEITDVIRSEQCSILASKIAPYPAVRSFLVKYQRRARVSPGLVADGRDMGTIIFPDAQVKFYFSADAEERVQRRYKQLKEQDRNVSLTAVRAELIQRDQRDLNRIVAPTKPAPDGILIDTTGLAIDQVFARVLKHIPWQTH